MLSSLGRLKTRPEFLRVAGSGRKWVTPGLILQVARRRAAVGGNSGAERPDAIRVGFTVSRKVGNSVARNRARRRLKAAAEEVLSLVGEAGCDYVIVGRAATLRRRWPELKADLEAAVQGLARNRVQSKSHSRGRKRKDNRPRRGTKDSGRGPGH